MTGQHDHRDLSRELSALQRHCIEKYEELMHIAQGTTVRAAPPCVQPATPTRPSAESPLRIVVGAAAGHPRTCTSRTSLKY